MILKVHLATAHALLGIAMSFTAKGYIDIIMTMMGQEKDQGSKFMFRILIMATKHKAVERRHHLS